MATDDRSSRQWPLQYKVEVILLCLLAAAAFGGPLFVRYVEYVGGLHNRCGDGVMAFIYIIGLLALAGAVFVLWAIIQLFLPPYTIRHILVRLAFVAAPPAILVGGFISNLMIARGSSDFLAGFERWVLREVDTDAIQQWLVTEGHKYTGRGYYSLEGLPGFLTEFEPTYISFPGSALRDGPCVKFEWGGPLGHWGVVIGLPTMPMPEEDPADLGPNEIEIRRSIKPGVYIFEQG